MTNNRKSMNASDAHAYKLRRSAAIAKQCSKGFRDVALTSGAPWALLAAPVKLII